MENRDTEEIIQVMKKVAIFDIDGTIFRSSLLIELMAVFVREGVMPAETQKVYAQARAKWLDREGSYEEYISAVVRAFESRIRGVPSKTFLRISNRVVAASGKRVYRYTRDLIQTLRRKKYFVLAVSNSPKIILDPFCKKWGFDKVYGRIYETDPRGRLTGKTAHLDLISDKAKILKRAVERGGLTLKDSIGVGDSEADIPFLKLVAHPICFNPNHKLFVAAKRHGWKVVVERKDVIYTV